MNKSLTPKSSYKAWQNRFSLQINRKAYNSLRKVCLKSYWNSVRTVGVCGVLARSVPTPCPRLVWRGGFAAVGVPWGWVVVLLQLKGACSFWVVDGTPLPVMIPAADERGRLPVLLAWGVFVAGVSILLAEAACLHKVDVMRLSRKWKPGCNVKMPWTLSGLLCCTHRHMDRTQKPYWLQVFACNCCLNTDWVLQVEK